jgi:hypothetical protein
MHVRGSSTHTPSCLYESFKNYPINNTIFFLEDGVLLELVPKYHDRHVYRQKPHTLHGKMWTNEIPVGKFHVIYFH